MRQHRSKIWLKGEQGTLTVPKDFPKADVFASWQPIPGEESKEMDLTVIWNDSVPVVKLASQDQECIEVAS